MEFKSPPTPDLFAKDAARGIRFALKRGAKMAMKSGPRQLPEQFEAASFDFFQGAERLAGAVDDVVKRILGLKFNEATFRAPSFALQSDENGQTQSMSEDASNLFFALTLCAKNMNIGELLASEALCARLMAEDALYDWPEGNNSPEAMSLELYRRLIDANVVGDPPGVRSSHNTDRTVDVRTVCFAASLWSYVPRGSYPDSELELLQICCDVAQQQRGPLSKAKGSDETLLPLFQRALDTI